MHLSNGGVQDYSALIDPRIKTSSDDILAAEDDDSINLGEATFEKTNRARSLDFGAPDPASPDGGKAKMGDGNDDFVLAETAKSDTGKIVGSDESRRKRRDLTEVLKEQEETVEDEETVEIPAEEEIVGRVAGAEVDGEEQYPDAEGVSRVRQLCLVLGELSLLFSSIFRAGC